MEISGSIQLTKASPDPKLIKTNRFPVYGLRTDHHQLLSAVLIRPIVESSTDALFAT